MSQNPRTPASAFACRLPVFVAFSLLAGCAFTTSRENVEATQAITATQLAAMPEWRRESAADEAARVLARSLLADGLSLPDAVSVTLLLNPELQLAFEELEISRAELVAASTPPNPVAIAGVRDPGGQLAAFYPDRAISLGLLQDLIALLNMPDRRAVARHELERQRLVTADRVVQLAVQATEAWLAHAAAVRIQSARDQSATAARTAYDSIVVQAADGGFTELDVAMERNGVFAVEGAAVRAVIDTATTRARLAEITGLAGWDGQWALAGELPPLPATDALVPEKEALLRRFDMQAALKAVDARLRVLATQRRFRWLGALEIGVFREAAVGGTPFVGPNVVVEIPLFDQRQAQLLSADSELRSALRRVESLRLSALTSLGTHAAEMAATRNLIEQYERLVLPNQQRIIAMLGGESDPGDADSVRMRLALLAGEEEYTGLLRDYWRARSAYAVAAADWSGLAGLPTLR